MTYKIYKIYVSYNSYKIYGAAIRCNAVNETGKLNGSISYFTKERPFSIAFSLRGISL
jgi:hypothetical protein